LRCPQAVMATGQVLLQRFYCKKSLREYNIKKLAAAATYLAIKLEECTNIRIRDVLMVFDRLIKRSDGAHLSLLEPGTREYQAAKDSIIKYERDLLRVFGFIVHADHPHKLLISFVKVLEGEQELYQEAWNIANDSLRTTLCVRFKSEVVASGAIFYAARKLQVPLPESVPWWEVFSVKTEQLVEVVRTLHELYQRPKAEYIHVLREPAAQPPRAPALTPDPTNNADNSPAGPDSSNINAVQQLLPTTTQSVLAGTGQGESKPGDNGEATSTAHQAGEEGARTAAADDAQAGTSGKEHHHHHSKEGKEGDRRDRDRDRDRRDRERDKRGSRSRSRSRSRDRDRDRDRRDRRDHRDHRDSHRDRDRDRDRRDRDRDRRDRDRDRDRPTSSRDGDRPTSSRDGRRDDEGRGGGRERSRLANASTAEHHHSRHHSEQRRDGSAPAASGGVARAVSESRVEAMEGVEGEASDKGQQAESLSLNEQGGAGAAEEGGYASEEAEPVALEDAGQEAS